MVADEAAAMQSKRRLVWPPATTHPLPARVPGLRWPRHPVPMCQADDTARVRAGRCHKHVRRNLRRRPVHDSSRPLRRHSALALCNAHHKSSAQSQPAPRTAAAGLAPGGGALPAESGRVHDLRGRRRPDAGDSEPPRLKNGNRSAWLERCRRSNQWQSTFPLRHFVFPSLTPVLRHVAAMEKRSKVNSPRQLQSASGRTRQSLASAGSSERRAFAALRLTRAVLKT